MEALQAMGIEESEGQVKRTAAVWALRYRKGGGHMFASGNWLAPWIFATRERARKAAREAKANKFEEGR